MLHCDALSHKLRSRQAAWPALPGKKPASKWSLKSKYVCPICDDIIKDQSSSAEGHDSVFCDGHCNTWLHCGCTGLSKFAFTQIAAPSKSFYCMHCSLSLQKKEVASLKAMVEELSSNLFLVNPRLVELSGKVNTPVFFRGDSNDSQAPMLSALQIITDALSQ